MFEYAHGVATDFVKAAAFYKTACDLGLPPGFLATRPGCAFDRTADGCGGVWSSASVDIGRGLLFFGTSACTQAANAASYEEAIVALRLDGTPAWRWKPRPTDTQAHDEVQQQREYRDDGHEGVILHDGVPPRNPLTRVWHGLAG